MALTFRWTAAGRAKQAADEIAGWDNMIAAAVGTPSHGALVGMRVAGPPAHVDDAAPAYPLWRDAHRRACARARRERQRTQRVAAAGLPAIGAVQPCQIDPATVPRDTLRFAILAETTSTNLGLSINGATQRTTAQAMAHLQTVLDAVETELLNRAAHREDHDLRSLGHPPVQIFMASEWYFRPPGRPHTQAEKAAIVTGLEGLSRAFPDWLIYPGTIYWTPDVLGPANQVLRVFNQAVVLYAGNVVATRTKRNSQDIDGTREWVERWGPDNLPLPAAVPAATLNVQHFNHKGYEFCIEICRDHPVGEAMTHYVGTPGADIFLLTANGTTRYDYHLPVRDTGIAVHCDGATHIRQPYVVTRPAVALNAAPLGVAWANYWADLLVERPSAILFQAALSEKEACQRDADCIAFKARYAALYAGPGPGSALRVAADAHLAANPPPALAAGAVLMAPIAAHWDEYRRIEHILGFGQLPAGQAITAAEAAIMVTCRDACRDFCLGMQGTANGRVNVNVSKPAFAAASGAVAAAPTGNTHPVPVFANFSLYDLIDAP